MATRKRRPHSAPKPRPPALPVEPPPLLRRLGLAPRKSLGQHFLVDEFALGDIADACRLEGDTVVLEIGAGPGGLTEELVQRAGHLVAVELDEELAAVTRKRLASHANLAIVAADVLDFTPRELLEEGGVEIGDAPIAGDAPLDYVACGNLPYYITQPVVRRLVEADVPPRRIVVMVQREVAHRMVGGPGEESLLSLSIRLYGRAELLFELPPGAFWPPPKVHSAVVRIERWDEPPLALDDTSEPRFFSVLRAGFSEPRKQMHNALGNALGIPDLAVLEILAEAGVAPDVRAQHLTLEEWGRLHGVIEHRHPRTLDVD
ncbi:MAG: ribosomal RNA small subunit methyltransferase A [Dehalococcoidia bacterium]|nr:ribosomal RNA small subunit methyltransferase A [Dehalococcoidia bacterium]